MFRISGYDHTLFWNEIQFNLHMQTENRGKPGHIYIIVFEPLCEKPGQIYMIPLKQRPNTVSTFLGNNQITLSF
jgi:hypothetical protein